MPAQGVARGQVPASVPVDETKVRVAASALMPKTISKRATPKKIPIRLCLYILSPSKNEASEVPRSGDRRPYRLLAVRALYTSQRKVTMTKITKPKQETRYDFDSQKDL